MKNISGEIYSKMDDSLVNHVIVHTSMYIGYSQGNTHAILYQTIREGTWHRISSKIALGICNRVTVFMNEKYNKFFK